MKEKIQSTETAHESSGVLLVDKPSGLTSHDVVNRVRRAFGMRRVGHTGTLDPMATGLLVVLVGRAAKAAEYIVCHRKRYEAVLRLGLTTDTEDVTGQTLTEHAGALPTPERVEEVCGHFRGEIMQVPPMYSALKVGGRKLMDIARAGGEVERQPRPITIYGLDCEPTGEPSDYRLSVDCSAGTYIRTLCADIGAELGCGGVMAGLRRVSVGNFDVSDALPLAALDSMTRAELAARLLPTETLFADCPAVVLPPFFERLCRSGCEIYQRKLGTALPLGTRVRLCAADAHFFALGEVAEYPDGTAVKAIKLFEV